MRPGKGEGGPAKTKREGPGPGAPGRRQPAHRPAWRGPAAPNPQARQTRLRTRVCCKDGRPRTQGIGKRPGKWDGLFGGDSSGMQFTGIHKTTFPECTSLCYNSTFKNIERTAKRTPVQPSPRLPQWSCQVLSFPPTDTNTQAQTQAHVCPRTDTHVHVLHRTVPNTRQ